MDILKAAVPRLAAEALRSPAGQSYRYTDLLHGAERVAAVLAGGPAYASGAERQGLGPRVAIMAPPGSEYVTATWGTWLAGGVAVPLCVSHPAKELAYVMQDAGISAVLASDCKAGPIAVLAQEMGVPVHVVPSAEPGLINLSAGKNVSLSLQPETLKAMQCLSTDAALFVYTSGTTGPPKGVVHTHGSISAQISALTDAWEWRSSDRLLHALPLHHIHGIVVGLYSAHAAGAVVEFLPRFSPTAVWERLMDRAQAPVIIFMGVPTMYSYLLSVYDSMSEADKAAARVAAGNLRLAVSGSAPCPLSVMQRWVELSGNPLLERYGMTETGMILSNPLEPILRVSGTVGIPLPGVEVRISPSESPTHDIGSRELSNLAEIETSNDREREYGSEEGGKVGELLVRGRAIFTEYWRRPNATSEAFTADGYFKTGDTVIREAHRGPAREDLSYYRILGRSSVDILKSGGYKISALDVENALMRHPAVREAAVVGVPDEMLGQKVAAVLAISEEVSEAELLSWAKDEMPTYQVPQLLRFVNAVPRNIMGKVNKKALLKDMFS